MREHGDYLCYALSLSPDAGHRRIMEPAKANAKLANSQATPVDNESATVAAAKTGDVEAFEALVNRYERKIFRLTQHITQNTEDAQDASQEAFLKAFEHLGNSGQFAVLHLAGAHRRKSGADEAAQTPHERYFTRSGHRNRR